MMADIMDNFSIFLIAESNGFIFFQTRNSKLTMTNILDVIGTGTVGIFFYIKMKKYHVKF